MTGDIRFFQRQGPFDVAAVTLCAEGDANRSGIMIEGVAPLHQAKQSHVSFLDNRRYLQALVDTQAGAVIVHPALEPFVPSHSIGILSAEPYAAWARVCRLFHPAMQEPPSVHSSASVDEFACLDPSVVIGPRVVVEAGASVGSGTRIGAGAVIQRGVVVGSDCVIEPGATVSHAIIGSRVHIGPGCRIGQEGFGFASTVKGFLAVPQLGRVLIEDDVRVGANTTIDRGSARDTIVGAGTWIDNLVQIAHNVTIGRHCIIVAQVGIAGSTKIGDFVRVGGQAAIAGHLEIGNRASIGAQAGVIGNVASNAELLGSPAQPKREFFRQMVSLRKTMRSGSS